MEKFLKIFIILITIFGTWFQESEYSDRYYDISEAHQLYTIAGEEYILLSDNLQSESTFEELIDDIRNTRRSSLDTKTFGVYSKTNDFSNSVTDFLTVLSPKASLEENTNPKQLLGYGLLYLCSLF